MPPKTKIFTPTFFAVCMFSMAFILLGNRMIGYQGVDYGDEDTTQAVVVEILDVITQSEVTEEYENQTVLFTAELTSGEKKGTMVDGEQYIDQMFLPVPEMVEVGESILLIAPQTEEAYTWIYASDNNVPVMAMMVALFFLFILLIGRGKGVATILSLLFTMSAIFLVYVPAILSGRNVYTTTIVVTAFIIFSSLILLNGANRKTFCAIVGNLGGTLAAGGLALLFNHAMGITGVVDQDYVFLTMLTGDVSVDLRAVVWGGILIGSLGAIMDVSMSIASAMNEIAAEMEERVFGRLVRAGMRIGQDAIGTMTNTLILAYVGGSMAVVLLFAAYNKDLMVVLNLEMISIEVIQAVVGSMGILVSVPLTVFFSAFLLMGHKKIQS